MDSTDTHDLLKCYGNDFFDKLHAHINTDIPVMVRNILLINDIDRAVLLASFDSESIKHIEYFMRNDFAVEMTGDQAVDDYLGKFVGPLQKKFVISYGHKLMINLMVEHCRKLVNTSAIEGNTQRNTPESAPEIANHFISSNGEHSEDYESIDQPVEDNGTGFLKYIGSLIITIFNDAKRLTLSGWSWPSRHVAAEKAYNYRVSGNPVCNPTLNYVTPTQHKQFLNCIVKGDLTNFAARLKNCLALSARVDGSVDRTQDHNLYVMGHLVNADTTTSTVFIGFDIPKESGALGAFECLKSVVVKILPWELFLHIISSIVTDGEELNLGSKSGLHVRLLNEIRKTIPNNKALLSIWCFAHRINLAWKDVCKQFPLISHVVKDASNLSSHFHNSGERTSKLNRGAAKKPLRYVTYFPVRWTEYVYDLLNVTLRNWRAAMNYFINEKEVGLEKQWLFYDRLHLITFLADVLYLFKIFQKEFESAKISILDVQQKRQKLFDKFQLFMSGPMAGGWEEFFLSEVDNSFMFYGHKLLKNTHRSTSTPTLEFNTDIRKSIIRSFMHHLTSRLDYDVDIQENLKPLASITSSVTKQSLKLCYTTIIPELNEIEFYTEYKLAANLLKNHEFKNPLDTLQKLQIMRPNELSVLKVALARVVAAKPHSADVETLIATYNKVKTIDRTSISGLSLFNYLYIKVNMPNLDKFDPVEAVEYWFNEKNRRPAESQTRTKQEFFKGVFTEADENESTVTTRIIEF